MRRTTHIALIFFTLVCSQWVAGQVVPRRMTNQDVKDLVAIGISSDVIIDKTRSTTTHFDTSVEALKSLKAAHVPDAVIRVMINPHADPVPAAAGTAMPPVPAKGMTNQDIKDLVGMGFSSDIIVEKIHTSAATDFDTSVEALKALKAAHVPETVISVMINPHMVPAAAPAVRAAPDPPGRPQEVAASPISLSAPLKGVKAVQVDSTIVSDAEKVKEPSAPTLVQDSLKNALRAASIDVAESAPIRAHIVLDEFTSGSTAKRMLVGFGSGRSSLSCRLVLQDASGKEVSSTTIHVRGKLAFSAYEGNNTQRKQAITSYEQKLLEEIERMKAGG